MARVKVTNTHEFSGTRVVGGKNGTRRIGKVRRFVFHPTEKRIIGFMVKRPDLLWMFHRKDRFVPIDAFEMEDGRVVVNPDAPKSEKAACKQIGVEWDQCVLWQDMPIATENETILGTVGTVEYAMNTGKVRSITVNKGATNKALLGVTEIPASMIKGFKTGIGAVLAEMGQEGAQEEGALRGAILVSDDVLDLQPEGGLAESAGKSAAVVTDKATKTVAKAKPAVQKATKATGKAVNKGAYSLGKQIGKTQGMFGSFKDEYKKAAGSDSKEMKRK